MSYQLGPGTYVRMKSTMESHVETVRASMFRQACDSVTAQLDSMCTGIEQLMTASVQDLAVKLQRDYLATLVGGGAEPDAAVPLAERMLHDQVRPILEDADSRFAEFCFPERDVVSAAAVGSEREEANLIDQQLEDAIAHGVEEASGSGTETGVNQEPL